MKKEKLFYRMRLRIMKSKAGAFIPSDFSDLSGYDQVLRVLRKMVASEDLIKIGQGIYAKTKRFGDGVVRPRAFIGDLTRQALRKYGIKTAGSSYWNAYNAGVSQQIPNGRVIAVSKRVRRKIGYDGYSMGFEIMGPKYKSLWYNR